MAKTGLVLEGGGMRGLFTAGILDVLMENNVTFDGVVGVSAGATFGCNFLDVISYHIKLGVPYAIICLNVRIQSIWA